MKEPEIDRIIREEIDKLLSNGMAMEAQLTSLDKRLEVIIKEARAKGTTKSVAPEGKQSNGFKVSIRDE